MCVCAVRLMRVGAVLCCVLQSWYFHAMPFLLLSHAPAPQSFRQMVVTVLWRLLLPVLALEGAFLTFPATPLSSTLLQLAHWFTLVQIRPLDPTVTVGPVTVGQKKQQ